MKSFTKAITLALFTLCSYTALAQFSVSGLVYNDYDNSSTLTASSNEGAIANVLVSAYNSADVLVATATTTGSGASNYTLSSLPNGSYRIEFTNLPNGYTATRAGATTVQFVNISGANVANINLGINHPSDYIQANPYLYTTQFASSGSTEVNQGVVVRFTRNGATSGRNQYIASYDVVGDVFGVATQSKTQRVLVAAYYRQGTKGVLGGNAGLGKIYVLNGNSTYTPPLASQTPLATITIPNAGTIPGTNPNAAVGKIGLGGIAISDDGNTLWAVNLNDKHLYRVDITNSASPSTPVDMGAIPVPAALSGRSNDWRPFALKYYHGKLYVGGVSSGQTNNNSIAVDGDPGTAGVQAPSSLLSSTNYNMYTITDNIGEVASYIVEIPNPLTSVTGSVVFSNTNMSYPRGRRGYQLSADPRYTRTNGRWRAWTDTYVSGSNTTTMSVFIDYETGNDGTDLYDYYTDWPMPMLTNIDFEANGSLLFAFRDRSTDMSFAYYAAGDISKACWVPNIAGTATLNGVAGNWFWEGTPGSCNYPVADPNSNSRTEPDASPGLNMQQTREWFMNDETASVAGDFNHEEQSFGGLAYKPAFTDVVNTSMNPINLEYNTAGVEYFATADGANVNAYKVENSADPGRVRKNNALGDVEYMADLSPIEIGNRIWNDVNGDGIQNPGEAPIANVALEIFVDNNNDGVPDGAAIGTTTTSATGEWYFNNSNITGDADPNTAGTQATLTSGVRYIVRPAASDWAGGVGVGDLLNYRLTGTDIFGNGSVDLSDNDAFLSGTGSSAIPQISVLADLSVPNNHNFDFGFKQLGAIGDKVWLDNGTGVGGFAADGLQNGSEPGVAGVTVELFLNGTKLGSTVTDAYGNYLFENLQTGAGNVYTVKVTPPANHSFTLQTNASGDLGNDAAGSDVNATGLSYNIILTAGETERDIDAGLVFNTAPVLASVGDRVWLDNGQGSGAADDGIQNGTEAGVAGITVTLFNASGVPVATAVTDVNGNYLFSNLPAGTYSVGFTLPPSFGFSPKDAGGNDNTDSDVNTGGANFGRTDNFTLAAGEQKTNVDAGINVVSSTRASLGDRVWNDVDRDGVQDADEPGIGGVTVTIVGPSGTLTTVTDANGNFQFTNLLPGSYTVTVTNPNSSQYTFTGQDVTTGGGTDLNDSDFPAGASATSQVTVTVSAGQHKDVDAGLYNNTTGLNSIGNYVWLDGNGDGVQDAGEIGLPGVTVTLVTATGQPVDNPSLSGVQPYIVSTDKNGFYRFTDLPNGNYVVIFSNLPGGYTFTVANGAGDNGTGTNSDVTAASGTTAIYNLTGGEYDQTVDAGIVRGNAAGGPSIGNRVWYDLDNDGVQDAPAAGVAPELGVGGVTVTLNSPGANGIIGDGDDIVGISATTTDALGNYLFTSGNVPGGLLPATPYYLRFTGLPAGYSFSGTQNAGSNDEADSDIANTGTGTTGIYILGSTEENLTVDAGINNLTAGLGSISNLVFIDTDGDGVQDGAATEPGLQGVTVRLFNDGPDGIAGNADDVFVASTTTDVNGNYLFDGLAADNYTVYFSNYPAGFSATGKDVGGDDALDSDAPGTGKSNPITLAAGQDRTDIDFGVRNTTTAALGNFVWFDSDNDGLQDAGEPGIAGVTVLLYRPGFGPDGIAGNADDAQPVASAVTDANGGYLFTNLVPGTYQVGFTNIPGGTSFTTQDQTAGGGNDTNDSDVNPSTGLTGNYVLAAGAINLTVDAGVRRQTTANVGNNVWYDANGNGLKDGGEAPVPGITVTLLQGTTVIGTAVTGDDGSYLFTNVVPGTYTIQFGNLPAGLSYTTQNAGGAGADNNSNPNGTGVTNPFTVAAGGSDITIDAGLIGSPLPADGLNLAANLNGDLVTLNWKTASEYNTRNFETERSIDNANFVKVGSSVAAAGNSISEKAYNTTDDIKGVQHNGTLYYRVKLYDENGSFRYSNVAAVRLKTAGIKVWPNPFAEMLQVSVNSQNNTIIELRLSDVTGRTVLVQHHPVSRGVSQLSISNIGKLPSGTYLLQLINAGDNTISTYKLNKE